MGNIKIKVTEITIPNDFRLYYKAGITPYPFDSGYTDYGVIFTGGTETVDLIGDFNYGEQYWIMGREIDYPERWMVKNIKINDSIIYQSFLQITPTPTPTSTLTMTPTPSITPSRTPFRTPTPTPSITPTPSFVASPSVTPPITRSPSITPSISKTPPMTPSRTPTAFGYGVTIYNCNGSICGLQVGSSLIETTVALTIGKYYTINDFSGDIIYVVSSQPIGGSSIIVLNGPFNSCNEACAAF